jgi:hypothetical protein
MRLCCLLGILLALVVSSCQSTPEELPLLREVVGKPYLRGLKLGDLTNVVLKAESQKPIHQDSLGLEYRYRPDSISSYDIEYYFEADHLNAVVVNVYPGGEAETLRLMEALQAWIEQRAGSPSQSTFGDYAWERETDNNWYLRLHPDKRSLTLNLTESRTGKATSGVMNP